MRILYLLLAFGIIISGCANTGNVKYPETRTVYVKSSRCPKFDRRLKIEIKDYNDEYGLISWKDVERIENFLKAKKRFNAGVDKINK